MRKTLLFLAISVMIAGFRPFWGFFAHERINRLAVFTLPADMIGFFKENIEYLSETSVLPDKRRYAVPEEGPRHYLDADHYGDSVFLMLPADWNEAVARYGEDTLQAYGILPWHMYRMYLRLRDAFMVRDPSQILRIAAELGHYVGDAHVPLHTTENYNGQLTGQEGIHGLWESRLPELFSDEYDFLVGRAEYIDDPKSAAWEAVANAHTFVKKVLEEEKKLAVKFEEKRYNFETRGNTTIKTYSPKYARAYHTALDGMLEKQMRAAIKMTGDLWFTAWVDAGQPDIRQLIDYVPSEEELRKNREEMASWKAQRFNARGHE